MIKNYLKIAFRNLWRSKLHTFINVIGLSIGLTVCLLLMLYVNYELSYDTFNRNYQTIYRVVQHQNQNNIWYEVGRSPAKMSPTLKDQFPEVKNATRFALWGNLLLSYKDKNIDEPNGIYAEPALFEMFTFSFAKGEAKQALENPNSIVLTESLAKKYFENENPIGQTIQLNQKYPMVITGIIKDIPANSHLKFDFVIPLDFVKNYGNNLDEWGGNAFYTYIQLHESQQQSAIDGKLKNFAKKTFDNGAEEFYLQPLKDIHLRSRFDFNTDFGDRGDIRYVQLFSLLALIVLLLACFNFMNLSTALASKRSKEVGLRKALGAQKRQLIGQFMAESALMVLMASGITLFCVEMLSSYLANFFGKNIFGLLNDKTLWLQFGALLIFTTLLSGSYPAFVLSSFSPVKIFRGQVFSPRKNQFWSLRNGLVVGQFTLSILMIIAVIVIYSQLSYMSNKKLGINKDNLVYVQMKNEWEQNFQSVKQELMKQADIESVSATNFYSMPFKWVGSTGAFGIKIDGKKTEKEFNIHQFRTEFGFLETMQIEIIEGRNFLEEIASDTNSVILSEQAVKMLDLENPIGRELDIYGEKGKVIGIFKDFHFVKLKDKIEPSYIAISPREVDYLLVRINPENQQETIYKIQEISTKYSNGYPVEVSFLDQDYNQLYKGEKIMETLFLWFTSLAIFISCLGLFGLATFATERRIKEIGIHKVLGASMLQITTLLSKDFLKLVMIAFVIASPIAYYFIDKWLADFAYRITISWWIFAVAGISAVLIALITVSWQSIKAAVVNPVTSLRSE
jgi:ABC-type antimicrobial peptide transport system permease subunit